MQSKKQTHFNDRLNFAQESLEESTKTFRHLYKNVGSGAMGQKGKINHMRWLKMLSISKWLRLF